QAVSRLTAKLDGIQATGVLALDLTWLNNNLQKALARHAAQASVQRLRLLDAPQRYTVLVCFLMQTYHETLDQLVEMYDKLVTANPPGASPGRPRAHGLAGPLGGLALLRDLNTTGRRTLPEQLPDTCLPKRLRAFVETNGTANRRAYECAVLTTLRDEIKRGN